MWESLFFHCQKSYKRRVPWLFTEFVKRWYSDFNIFIRRFVHASKQRLNADMIILTWIRHSLSLYERLFTINLLTINFTAVMGGFTSLFFSFISDATTYKCHIELINSSNNRSRFLCHVSVVFWRRNCFLLFPYLARYLGSHSGMSYQHMIWDQYILGANSNSHSTWRGIWAQNNTS